MNMDSEDEGVFTVSCAGGASVICKIPYETETVNASVHRNQDDWIHRWAFWCRDHQRTYERQLCNGKSIVKSVQ